MVESPLLEVFKWCLDVVCGGFGSVALRVGLDIKSLFQPKWFCEPLTGKPWSFLSALGLPPASALSLSVGATDNTHHTRAQGMQKEKGVSPNYHNIAFVWLPALVQLLHGKWPALSLQPSGLLTGSVPSCLQWEISSGKRGWICTMGFHPFKRILCCILR